VNATKVYTFTNTWGYKNNKSNEWNGMIGDLFHNNADIGGNYITLILFVYLKIIKVKKI